MTLELPRYCVTSVPKDFAEPGILQDRYFMRDEAYLQSQLAEIARRLALPVTEDIRSRFMRSKAEIQKALDTAPSRAGLTFADLHAVHVQSCEDSDKWLRSGAASLMRPYAFAFANPQRYVQANLPITYIQQGTAPAGEGGQPWLDTAGDVTFLLHCPIGVGVHPNTLLPYVHAAIAEAYPDSGLYQKDPVQAPWWWTWRTTTEDGLECGTLAVCMVNGYRWYGTWPRVKTVPESKSVALYGAEVHYLYKLTGIIHPYYAYQEAVPPPTLAEGESHERDCHGIANFSCHSDLTNTPPPGGLPSWGTTVEPTTWINGHAFVRGSGGWLVEGQVECIEQAATLEGYNHANIIVKIPKPPTIMSNVSGNTVRPTTSLFPFPVGGRWRINGVMRDEYTGQGAVTIDLIGAYGYPEQQTLGTETVTLPPIVIPPPDPIPPAAPLTVTPTSMPLGLVTNTKGTVRANKPSMFTVTGRAASIQMVDSLTATVFAQHKGGATVAVKSGAEIVYVQVNVKRW